LRGFPARGEIAGALTRFCRAKSRSLLLISLLFYYFVLIFPFCIFAVFFLRRPPCWIDTDKKEKEKGMGRESWKRFYVRMNAREIDASKPLKDIL